MFRGAHIELKEDVAVRVLVGEGDGALLLQAHHVHQSHSALVTA